MADKYQLRLFRKEDIPILMNWLEGTDLAFLRQFSGLSFSWPLTPEQLEKELETQMETAQESFLYSDEATGSPLGFCQLRSINDIPGRARIARVLIAPEERGRGIGRCMLEDLANLGKDAYGLRSYTLSVYDFNASARRSYERIGFRVVESYTQQIKDLNETWSGVIMRMDFTD